MKITNRVIITACILGSWFAACSSSDGTIARKGTAGSGNASGTSGTAAGAGTGGGWSQTDAGAAGSQIVTLPDGATVQIQADGGQIVLINPTTDGATTAPPGVEGICASKYMNACLGTGVTPADVARFAAAAPGSCTGPQIDYPLDRAVMPRNVYPPKIMWTPRQQVVGTDLYRVRLSRPSAVLDGYFLAGGLNNSWRPAIEDFTPIANADLGTPIDLTITVLTDSGLCEGKSTFRTVDAYIAGSVYYWAPDPSLKRIMRVDVTAARLVDFMPRPGGCIACHGVTRDGKRMAAYGGQVDGVGAYDLTADLTGNPPPLLYTAAVGLGERISAFNGDGSRLLLSIEGGGLLDLYSGTTGAQIKLDILGGKTAADPEWSPDNSTIAYTDANNLMVVPALAGDSFGTPVQIHAGNSSPGGPVDWHPTWTPDSQWLAYQHGDTAKFGSGRSIGKAGLWMITKTGSGNVPLTALNGNADNYRPIFSPFDSGTYFWVLFTSPRPYGNAAGVIGQKQLWIAAVHDRPGTFGDPSEVPYYLDGQDPVTNLSAYWAPKPCQPNGASCTTDSDCCVGSCTSGSCTIPASGPPPCRNRGESCSVTADCCNGAGLSCLNYLCDIPVPIVY